MRFPSHPDQLSSAWLTEALGYTVTDFDVELFGEGAGIIGMVTRVNLETKRGTQSIIAKFPSPAEENRAVAATYDMYGREVGFYRDIAATINLRVPDCYYHAIDPQTQAFVLLLEDLREMRIGDQVAGCTEADAELVLKGIAKLHASTWEPSSEIISHNNPGQRDGMIAGFKMGWPVVLGQFADLIPTAAKDFGEVFPQRLPQLLETMCQPPVCIAHADVRLDNIFFNTNEIALVDWQSVCASAPEQDLAYFVTQSLSADVRNAQDWVALYHEALAGEGVKNYSLEQCRERYRVAALYLASYATVIAGTLDLGNERGLMLGRTLFGNSMASLDELGAFALLD